MQGHLGSVAVSLSTLIVHACHLGSAAVSLSTLIVHARQLNRPTVASVVPPAHPCECPAAVQHGQSPLRSHKEARGHHLAPYPHEYRGLAQAVSKPMKCCRNPLNCTTSVPWNDRFAHTSAR